MTSMVNLCFMLKIIFKVHNKHQISSQIVRELHLGPFFIDNFLPTEAYGILGMQYKLLGLFVVNGGAQINSYISPNHVMYCLPLQSN